MRQILAKCWEQNTDTHNLFIDFQAAYDTVWRKQIRSEMHKIGPPQKKIDHCAKFQIMKNMLRLKLENIL